MSLLNRWFGGSKTATAELEPPEPVTGAPFTVEWVRGEEVVERLHALRTEIAPRMPIVLGDTFSARQYVDDLAALREMQQAGEPAAELSTAAAVDWLNARAQGNPDGYRAGVGDWPDAEPNRQLAVLSAVVDGPPDWLAIAHMDATESADVLRALHYGGWNECPPVGVHCALATAWAESFGARLAVATLDSIEFTVDRPPTTREAALELATLHFLYCPDLVQQGTRTLSGLAATLLEAPVWSFWWD